MAQKRKELPIEWDLNELEHFKQLIKDIKKRSEDLASHIKDKVKERLTLIKQNPYIFEADSLKTDNDGSFRKFTAIHIRIAYKIDPDKIIIARVRHAASEPTEY
jgi:mRNA-degrading endonuclease RelE of RelBE toxin-antitoxin system